MSSSMPQIDAPQIIACTVSRDVQNFDLLIEDMESALGEAWGDLGFSESLAFFSQPEAATLELIALALDSEDEENLPMMSEIISQAKSRHIKVILIAEDVTPAALHQLLRKGADEFVPYPLPEGELAAAVARLGRSKADPAPEPASRVALKGGGDGVLIAVQGLCGGCGTTAAASTTAAIATTVVGHATGRHIAIRRAASEHRASRDQ